MKKVILSTAGIISTLVAAAAIAIPAAQAEHVIIQSRPALVVPQRVIVQPAQQYVRRTFVSAPVETHVISRPAVILRSEPVVEQTITQEALISPLLSERMENFRARLDRISEQIAMGQSRGWLSAAAAEGFQLEYRALASRADDVMLRGGSKLDGDVLEKQINVLNQRVTDTMSH